MPLLRDYVITSPFGMRKHPITNKEQLHEGIDIKCSYENIYAYADGEVIRTAYHKNLGYYVDIQHCGYITRYQHLSKFRAEVGQKVKRKQLIAVSGNTGMSTGAHLHFGIKVNGKWVDPEMFSPVKIIEVKLNDKIYKGLLEENGTSYIEIRETFEDLGAKVTWSAENGVEIDAKNIKNIENVKTTLENLLKTL